MDYKNTIREFIISNFLFGDTAALRDDTPLLEAGIIDSTGVLELVAFLEQRCDVRVLDQEMVPENLDSVNRLARFVIRKLAPQEAANC